MKILKPQIFFDFSPGDIPETDSDIPHLNRILRLAFFQPFSSFIFMRRENRKMNQSD
jgi:hypothetical protein